MSKYPDHIERAARRRLDQASGDIARAQESIRQGRPLDAETDIARAIERVMARLQIDDAVTAKRIVDYDNPSLLDLMPDQKRKAEALQGKSVDYLGVAWLAAGKLAANAVARIISRDGSPIGSGFMVSDRLLLTNRHVIPEAVRPEQALIEFGFEQPLDKDQPSTVRFEVGREGILASSGRDDLDYTLIELGACVWGDPDSITLAVCPLSESSAKHSVGEPVNIVQHPDGDLKQVVVRENRIVYRGEHVLHYIADTEGGASGSPVFNDSWQVVALHHWGGPHREQTADGRSLDTNANEGIRVSAIVRDIRAKLQHMNPQQRRPIEAALRDTPANDFGRRIVGWGQHGPQSIIDLSTARIPATPPQTPGPQARTTMSTSSFHSAPPSIDDGSFETRVGPEAATIDRNYANRRGYDPRFLKNFHVPMPQLSAAQRRVAARVRGVGAGADPFEIKYQHFSVVLNARRRMPFFSICNIDGSKHITVDRKSGKATTLPEAGEAWAVDPRVPPEAQLNDAFYARVRRDMKINNEYFARGHMTRREDPNWGSAEKAERANADTFHHPNGCPQVQNAFNGSQRVWQGIENYILDAADDSNLRVTVITGPVFNAEDPPYHDEEMGEVLFPRKFWKVVARVENGKPVVFAVIADQSKVLDQLMALQDRPEAAWTWPSKLSTEFQTTIEELAELTGLDFGDLAEHDIAKGQEESLRSKPRIINRPEDLLHGAITASEGYGKFASLGEFLDAWERRGAPEETTAESEDAGAERRGKRKKKPSKPARGGPRPPAAKKRLVVDVEATVDEVFRDDLSGSFHQQFAVKLTGVVSADAAARAEVDRAVNNASRVRVAVRYGDSRGIADRVPGIVTSAQLHLKGEWIPAAAAYDVGGEDIPVLHFTHDPLGFICTTQRCYS